VLSMRFEDFPRQSDIPTRNDVRAYAAVVMNPPFALPGDRQAWVSHLERAWGLLAEGGQLRAIVPASLEYGRQRRIAAVRELIVGAGGSWRPAPEGAFKASGTEVRTLLVEASR
ncbi:MAG: hypothetical protein ACRDXB_11180, partial [Actinomycetes bacterium]